MANETTDIETRMTIDSDDSDVDDDDDVLDDGNDSELDLEVMRVAKMKKRKGPSRRVTIQDLAKVMLSSEVYLP